jgi:hypothetical protein
MQHRGSACESGHLIDIVADKTGLNTCVTTIIVLVRALLPGIHSAGSSQQQLFRSGFNIKLVISGRLDWLKIIFLLDINLQFLRGGDLQTSPGCLAISCKDVIIIFTFSFNNFPTH